MKSREEVAKYLRTQAFWINVAADQIEAGEPVTCEWCIDLEVPKVEQVQARLIESEAKTA